MKNKRNFSKITIPLNGIGIVFIVLKLTGIIDWSWIWVLSPIWVSWLIFIPIMLLFFIVSGLMLSGKIPVKITYKKGEK